MKDQPWWRGAVVYHIYPRSFADSDGDGLGDLEGVRRNLDYLQWLGVDGFWLSPFYRSPFADGGYDVVDYCDVDPRLGTLEDFDRLLTDAHARGLKVLVDWVPNHTSDQHPWFRDALTGRDAKHRDWYHWIDEPNNWRAALNQGSAWELHEETGQYYLHLFFAHQPDLNWANPEVVAAMHDTLRFWLDRGVDGFRIDVPHCLGKDPMYADDDRCLAGRPVLDINHQPATHDILRGIRKVVDAYGPDKVTVGEVGLRTVSEVVEYYGSNDELHLVFNFSPLDAPWDPIVWRDVVREVERQLANTDCCPTWVLSNHDNARLYSRYGRSDARARAAAVLLLTLRGTAFVYQGDELGVDDVDLPPSRWQDPGGRDLARGPMPWTPDEPHGWTGRQPWVQFPPHPEQRNVQTQRADPGSLANLYRALIRLRKEHPVLTHGRWEEIDTPPGVFGYRRTLGSEKRVVLLNFARRERQVSLPGEWQVELDSAARLPEPGNTFDGIARPDQALLLRPGLPAR
ncbi:MAG: alpha-amylase family glycosyl hydrolase [Micromonosporaceae bacterium]